MATKGGWKRWNEGHPPSGLRVRGPGPGERSERRRRHRGLLQRGSRAPSRVALAAALSAAHATASQQEVTQRARLARRLSWGNGQQVQYTNYRSHGAISSSRYRVSARMHAYAKKGRLDFSSLFKWNFDTDVLLFRLFSSENGQVNVRYLFFWKQSICFFLET